MTIVIDNVMRLACVSLGMMIIKCDFRSAAHQEEGSGPWERSRARGNSSSWEHLCWKSMCFTNDLCATPSREGLVSEGPSITDSALGSSCI